MTGNVSRNRYQVVSAIAYLIGVSGYFWEREEAAAQQKVFEQLEQNRNAQMIRNLCIVRTQLMRNLKSFRTQLMAGKAMAEIDWFPYKEMEKLYQEGVNLFGYRADLASAIVEINRNLGDRIGNCRSLFPDWLNWDYVRNVFLMPDGLKKETCLTTATYFYQNRTGYPYQCYLNWKLKDEGNILLNDKKFVELLYEQNGDRFEDTNKVQAASSWVKGEIGRFLEESRKTTFVVDCENADPFNFCAAVRELEEQLREKIFKIILCDDVNSSTAWGLLERYIDIPVERILVERVTSRKSLVDVRLTAETCREHYQNQVDSFVIVSSDSDYYGMITALSTARFLLMIEREKSSPDLRQALTGDGIFYCYTDDFYQGDPSMLRKTALMAELKRAAGEMIRLNARKMLQQVLAATRISMSPEEEEAFYRKVVKPMALKVGDDGEVTVEFGRP